MEINQKEPNPNEPNPRHTMSNNPAYLDLLINLLSNADKPYAGEAWSLLTRLPFNDNIVRDLKTLDTIARVEDWEHLLSSQSFHRLLYSLLITDRLLDDDKSGQWG
jgi:hypothetical protein